jgi:hypothetical protein
MTPYLPALKWLGVGVLIVGVWFHGYSKGNDAGEVEVAKLTAKHAETMRSIEEEFRRLEAEARIKEHQMADELAKIAAAYEDDKHEIAQSTRNAVLADLRAGRIRLRQPTQTVPATDQSPAAAGQCDGQAASGSQAEGDLVRAADIIAIGAESDAQLAACQSVIQSYRLD